MTGLEHLIADREMRQLLAELSTISHGQTTSWNSSGGGSTDRLFPPGEHAPPHERFRRMYLAATDDGERGRVRDQARDALNAARRGPGTVATTVTGDARE